MSADEHVDLDELAAWCRQESGHPLIRPSHVQHGFRVRWNAACSALEALEARGDLDRVPGPALAWRPAPAPQKPGKASANVDRVNQALRHLERLREAAKGQDALKGWLDALTEDLMKLLVGASVRATPGCALPLSPKEHGALLRLLDGELERRESIAGIMDRKAAGLDDKTTEKLRAYKADAATLRAVRSRLKETT